jgi:CxxC motif-containing protein (DUF1111 family)
MITPPKSETAALQNVTANLFSDLLVHHIGKGLADDITQGVATGDKDQQAILDFLRSP